ncbi:MAG: NAD(+)/NADH kinase [Oscillospiraceae bacterium]
MAICPNPKRDIDLKYTKEAARILRGAGCTCVLTFPFETELDGSSVGLPLLPLEQAVREADLMVSLGGDGTILRVAPWAARESCPISAVNVGNLGFICDLEAEELPLLARLAEETYHVESRMMLDVTVRREGREVYSALALNEAVVNKGAVSRVVNLRTGVNGQRLFDMRGDGLIVATATGSTGYSRSSGGPVVSPAIRGIIVTPICAMNLHISALVLEAGDTVTLEPLEKSYTCGFLSVDGGRAFSLRKGDVIEIARSRFETRLIRLTGRGFFDDYDRKMGLGGTPNEK